ncbi:MAG: hypothetical protein DCC52_06265 [Chloroflexi bacterium]|nr:MAG: hypothetical protein DCC52_06265 [Chloroflexota bacterium]
MYEARGVCWTNWRIGRQWLSFCKKRETRWMIGKVDVKELKLFARGAPRFVTRTAFERSGKMETTERFGGCGLRDGSGG